MGAFLPQLDYKLEDFFRDLEGFLRENGLFQSSRRILLKTHKVLSVQFYFPENKGDVLGFSGLCFMHLRAAFVEMVSEM